MKKFLFVFLVLVMVVCCFVSCNKNDDKTNDTTQKSEVNVETSSRLVLMSVTKDIYGNTIKEMFEDKYSHKMYIWEYEYTNRYGEFVLTNSWMTVIDAEGNEVPDEPQVNVNGCTCPGNSGDAYNDVYPGYRVPECNCMGNSSVNGNTPNTDSTQQEIKPCIVYNKNNIVITITKGEYNELFNVWQYTLKIENGSTSDIVINSTDESFNNMMLSTLFGFYETIPAGKTAVSSLSFWDLEELGITDLVGTLTMTIEVSNSDTYDTIDETVVNIEFK